MSPKTVLVTGATGFLGRQVVKAFEFHDWNVKGTGYTRSDGVDILKVDLSNAAEVEKVLDQEKCVPSSCPVQAEQQLQTHLFTD